MRSFFRGKKGVWKSWPAVSVLLAGLIWLPSCKKQEDTSLTADNPGISQNQSTPRYPEKYRTGERAGQSAPIDNGGRQLDQLLRSTPSSDHESALEGIIYEYAAKNPELSCTAFQRLREHHTLNPDVTRFLAAALADFDPEEAWLWIKQLPKGPHRKIAVGELCLKIAPEEPAHAADLATLNLPLSDGHESVFLRIAEAWALTDPPAAAKWAGRFPTGTARTDSLKAILANWDPTAASAWASTLADTSLRTEVETLLARKQ